MGSQGDLEALCAPGTDVALAAGNADLDEAQLANASAVVAEGRRLAVPDRAILVALAVAQPGVEVPQLRQRRRGRRPGDLTSRASRRRCELPHEAVGTDHGSLGIFQQQWPWWGTMRRADGPDRRRLRKFYSALLEVPDWESMPVTEAAQARAALGVPRRLRRRRGHSPAAPAGGSPSVARRRGASSGLLRRHRRWWLPELSAVAGQGRCSSRCPRDASYVDQANWGNGGATGRRRTPAPTSRPPAAPRCSPRPAGDRDGADGPGVVGTLAGPGHAPDGAADDLVRPHADRHRRLDGDRVPPGSRSARSATSGTRPAAIFTSRSTQPKRRKESIPPGGWPRTQANRWAVTPRRRKRLTPR